MGLLRPPHQAMGLSSCALSLVCAFPLVPTPVVANPF